MKLSIITINHNHTNVDDVLGVKIADFFQDLKIFSARIADFFMNF